VDRVDVTEPHFEETWSHHDTCRTRTAMAMAQVRTTCVARRNGWTQTNRNARRNRTLVQASGPYAATVGDTKAKFYAAYPKPIPSVYNNVLLELLVQQHLYRYHKNYEYSPVFSTGFCSVFDQVMEGYETEEVKAIFDAYINSLEESPEQYRNDATRMEAAAESAGSADGLFENAETSEALNQAKARMEQGKFLYTKFFTIGLFRLLEKAGNVDPASLDKVISHVGISKERVTSDLGLYKGILNKMAMAKELMQELVEREKKQQAEREAEKATKAT